MRHKGLIALVSFLVATAAGLAEADAGSELDGRTVGVLIADGFHGGETRGPIEYLRERGATVLPIGIEAGEVKSGKQSYTIERTVDQPQLVDDLDAVVIPGGNSPKKLRQVDAVLEFVRAFAASGKPLAAICHGPQVLISAGVLDGRRATCVVVEDREYFDVRDELTEAGAEYRNEPVVSDGNIITSRLPQDVPRFSAAIAQVLRTPRIPFPPANGAWIGDFGHYLTSGTTDVHLLNTEGESFTVTLHRYNWVFEPGTRWNSPKIGVTVNGPDGEEVLKTSVETHERGARIQVPAAGKGRYTVRVSAHGLNYWRLSTNLPRAVASASRDRAFTTTPIVPRRWYFYVPEDTKYFSVLTWGHKGRSQREDHGLTVRSPQGQRMAMLWDNPNPMVRDGEVIWGRDRDDLEQLRHIVVEPGSDGRLWSLEIEMGDAHIWSNFPVALEGVPPYLAASPEQWFNPETDEPSSPKLYEETAYVRKKLPEDGAEKWPHFAHWMPGASGGRKDWMAAPSLGDNASNHLRPPTRFALANPEGRDLTLHICDYVPRDPAEKNIAEVRVLDTEDNVLETLETNPLGHNNIFEHTMAFEGVRYIEVDNVERFWAFTYPGTPVVLEGADTDDDWQQFRLEAGARRHWYFRVPEGTFSFEVRMNTGNPGDVAAIDINTPDRTMARLYGTQQSATVTVPPGMDGKIWHFSVGVGSSTRFFPADDEARNLVIDLDLDVRGIPAFLAPTWDQWFNPETEK
ncbi:MAG: DJ-1/PfpI family protein [Verrucomicrobiota bacterium]